MDGIWPLMKNVIKASVSASVKWQTFLPFTSNLFFSYLIFQCVLFSFFRLIQLNKLIMIIINKDTHCFLYASPMAISHQYDQRIQNHY